MDIVIIVTLDLRLFFEDFFKFTYQLSGSISTITPETYFT